MIAKIQLGAFHFFGQFKLPANSKKPPQRLNTSRYTQEVLGLLAEAGFNL